ncbi:MAG: hypothetical protein WAL02_03865 [Rhodoplanes sp.]|jgi:hypothetical protein
MQVQGLEKLIDIAATVASAIEPPAGKRVSATHAALLASRLFEAIKAERAALDPADLRTRALLDHALDHCEKLTFAGERLPMRLQAVSALLAGGVANSRSARRPRGEAKAPPPPCLRLFQVIDGGQSA